MLLLLEEIGAAYDLHLLDMSTAPYGDFNTMLATARAREDALAGGER